MADAPYLLLGCGILGNEVRHLIRKNNWPLETLFVDSMLHVDLQALASALQGLLTRQDSRRAIVFYGACHPLMDSMLAAAGAIRTEGQNCVEMLLGTERFTAELEGGSYFLLEDWARRWDNMITRTFGSNLSIVRDIFADSHSSLLCLRTPCSGDFTAEAHHASRQVQLPLRWLDVPLDNLEAVLQRALNQRLEHAAWKKP